jgi:hypothetical protein
MQRVTLGELAVEPCAAFALVKTRNEAPRLCPLRKFERAKGATVLMVRRLRQSADSEVIAPPSSAAAT